MMKRLCFFLLPLLPVLFLSACGGTDAIGYRTLPLGEDVTLRIGEKVGLTGDGVTELEIKKIRDDSRCPVNADCIWAGTAFVEAELHKSPFLLTADAPAPESFSVEWLKDSTTKLTVRPRYKIAFVNLSPENFAPNTIAQGDYKITLRITKVSP
jgi:hypothetical protein